jgi:hypothetical protein
MRHLVDENRGAKPEAGMAVSALIDIKLGMEAAGTAAT